MKKKRKVRTHARKGAPPAKKPALVVGEPIKTEGLKFVAGGARSTSYQPIIDKMRTLEQGQSIPIEVPDGMLPRIIHNRVQAVINRLQRRKELEAPKGCLFEKKSGTHPKTNKPCVFICCRKDDGRPRPGPKVKIKK